jgi:hypothetical protein
LLLFILQDLLQKDKKFEPFWTYFVKQWLKDCPANRWSNVGVTNEMILKHRTNNHLEAHNSFLKRTLFDGRQHLGLPEVARILCSGFKSFNADLRKASNRSANIPSENIVVEVKHKIYYVNCLLCSLHFLLGCLEACQRLFERAIGRHHPLTSPNTCKIYAEDITCVLLVQPQMGHVKLMRWRLGTIVVLIR